MRQNIFKYMLMGAALCGAFISCQKEEAHDPLQGLYQAPVDVTVNSAEVTNTVKGEGVRTISLKLGSVEGVNLNIDLVTNKYYLQSTTYSKAVDTPKNGNYTSASINGKEVTSGALVLEMCDGGYLIKTSVLFTADQAYRLKGQVELTFDPDPEPVKLTQVLSVNTSTSGQITLNLGSAGLTSTPNMYGGADITGDGVYLALDIYSPDGKLHPGTYSASSTGGVIGENQFGIGWDPGDLFGWGMIFENWGTCVWTLEDSVPSAWKVTEGEITVALQGSKYTITYLQPGVDLKTAVWVEFTGAIEGLTPEEGGADVFDGETLNSFIFAADYSAWGGAITLMLGDGAVSINESQEWSGTGHYLAIDIKSLEPGTYVANTVGGVLGEGEFGIGYDQEYDYTAWGGDKGINYDYGTCWWTVEDGVRTAQKVLDGTITIELADEIYTLTLESTTVNVRYTGPITL